MSVARRLAGESSGWMSFPWPDPTDRCLKGDSPAEVQSLSLVAGRGGWQRGGKAILTLVKKVLVVGVGVCQLPPITAVQRLGFSAVVNSQRPTALERNDQFHTVHNHFRLQV